MVRRETATRIFPPEKLLLDLFTIVFLHAPINDRSYYLRTCYGMMDYVLSEYRIPICMPLNKVRILNIVVITTSYFTDHRMSVIHTFLNYFHRDPRYNRSTFGLDQIKGGPALVFWRFTDAVLVVILLVVFHLVYDIQPFQRQFYVNDLLISHPFAEHERVTNNQLFLYAGAVPLVTIAVVSLVITKPKNKIYVTYVSLIGLLLSLFITSVTTDILKNAFGRHRPDFLARCVPSKDAPKDVLVYAVDVCTTTDIGRLMDGFRTTPLGHSSLSFAGLLYLLYFLTAQLAATRPQAGAWRSVVAFTPVVGAALIALSRTEDYRHHFIDVFVGLVLGSVIGLWLYFRLFPGLAAEYCYEPRLLRIKEDIAELAYAPVEEV